MSYVEGAEVVPCLVQAWEAPRAPIPPLHVGRGEALAAT